MIGKVEQVLEYIESLADGKRVSVRQLAKELSVSEGTAYKAICQAKEKGLVQSKPKSGTVRVATAKKTDEMRLSWISDQLGLSLITGESQLDEIIDRIILADSSVEQFRLQLQNAEGKLLCLVGDRQDIIKEAIINGIAMIVTGGAKVSSELIWAAEEKKICILSSEQDSMMIVQQLSADFSSHKMDKSISDKAKDWMEMPLFLYRDDVAADWHRLYRRIFDLFSKCAVVDHKQMICGSADAMQIASAELTSKISSMSTSPCQCLVADENILLAELTDRMIAEHKAVAYLTRDEEVSGIITTNDILRYFRLKAYEADIPMAQAIVLDEKEMRENCHIYNVTLSHLLCKNGTYPMDFWISIITKAAAYHARVLWEGECECETGSFYFIRNDFHGNDLMVSSEVIKQDGDTWMLSLNLYDSSKSYAKATMIVRKGKENVFTDR